ncbi:alpha/beta hydrolase [bacterium]|nr:alpha/beta hydrolase [bacterium]
MLVFSIFLFISVFTNSTVAFKHEKNPDFTGKYQKRDYPGKEKFIAVNGINICYIDNNRSDKKVVVFLHGLSLSTYNFRFNYPRFDADYHVIALDFPGFGKSDVPNASYSIAFFSDFLHEFLKTLNLKKVTLIGNSLGSHTALKFALDYPEMVDALVIESSTGIRQHWGIFEDIIFKWYICEKRFLNLSEKKMREYIQWSWTNKSPASEELVRHRIMFRRKYYHTLVYKLNNLAFTRGLEHVISDSIRNEVERIKTPTLIIWGRKDKVTHISDAYYLHKKIKGSELHFIDGSGHLAHIETPDEFNRVVQKYLKKILK